MKLNKLIILGTTLLVGTALLPVAQAQDSGPGFSPQHAGAEGHQRRGPGAGRGRHRPGHPGGNPNLLIERLDSDGDGYIDEDEFLDARLARVDDQFDRRDADGDGLLSEEEASRPPRRGPRGDTTEREEVIACVRETITDWEGPHEVEDRFDAVDTDLDGYITLAELSTALAERAYVLFDRIDANSDGLISPEDITAHQDNELNLRRVIRACVDEVSDPFEAPL